MLKPLIWSTAVLAVLAASGCGPRTPSQGDAAKPAAAVPASAPAPAALSPLAAAEAFEALTEGAFSATPQELAAAVAKAEAAAEQVRPALAADAQRDLQVRLAEVRTAHRADNRTDLALASVEAYRTLVSAAPRTSVPVEVSLLDYAGFRYQADLRAHPERWDDMAMAAAFARQTWSALSPRVSDGTLRARLDVAVTALGGAVPRRDHLRAEAAAGTELDLVDQLEAYFGAKVPTTNPAGPPASAVATRGQGG